MFKPVNSLFIGGGFKLLKQDKSGPLGARCDSDSQFYSIIWFYTFDDVYIVYTRFIKRLGFYSYDFY